MKYFSSIRRTTRCLAFVPVACRLALIAAALMAPMNSAHARQQILRGEIEAQYICHDGANRGATVRLILAKSNQQDGGKAAEAFGDTGGKHYYAPTTCTDLRNYYGDIYTGYHVYVWTNDGIENGNGHTRLCEDFHIKYYNNGKQVWIQNGGSTVFNVTCVAKDGL